jgi:multidrug efflux pump subunit AcrA (membrane-fusion protein)
MDMRIPAAAIGLGLSALLLTGCTPADAESLGTATPSSAAALPSGPTDLEHEQAAAAAAATAAAQADAARVAAEAEAARVAQAAADQAAADQAAADAAAAAPEARAVERVGSPVTTSTPAPAAAPVAQPAPAPRPSNVKDAAHFTGLTLVSCSQASDSTWSMVIDVNYTFGSERQTVPGNEVDSVRLPSGERVGAYVECGM